MRPLVPLLGLAVLASSSPAQAASPDGARHARDADGIFWFMHLSDSHIGANPLEGPKAKEHLQFALNQATTVIKPRFVWNTGDLQDGSGKIGVGGTGIPTSGQSQTQWDAYKSIYQAAGMKVGFYYDLVGNHDVYGDDGATFYLKNSLWGSTQHKTWMDFKITTKTGEYGFFGMNSTNNYFKPYSNCCPGFLDDEIALLDAWLTKNASAKLLFVAAHHALDGNGSEPTAKADRVRALLKKHKAFYLHGDKHEYEEYLDSDTIVVNQLGSLGKNATANIGIGVVDHDAFVYRATGVENAWPFAILTAPTAENLRDVGTNPYAYAVCRDRSNNPFRALTFSFTPPTKVTVKVGSLAEVAMKPVSGKFDFGNPVWQADVDTRSLPAASTNVTVKVEADGATNTHQIVAKFSAGPCDPLPGDPVAPSDDAGASTADASVDAPTERDAGVPLEAGDLPAASTEADTGCSCRTEAHGPTHGPWVAVGMVALGSLRRRRRATPAALRRAEPNSARDAA